MRLPLASVRLIAAVILALLLVGACDAGTRRAPRGGQTPGGAGAAPPASVPLPFPGRITPEWIVAHRLKRPMEAYHGFETVRARPDLRQSLAVVAADTSQDGLVRSNALLMLGATDHPEARAFLVRFHDGLPPCHQLQGTTVRTFGFFPSPDSSLYRRLSDPIKACGDIVPHLAIDALVRLGTPEARQLLLLRRVDAPAWLHGSIDLALRRFPPAPMPSP